MNRNDNDNGKYNYKKIVISAPAKINLYLEILDKLDNGYHNIDSIMQSVDLADMITISVRDTVVSSLVINLVCDNINIPIGKNNLAYIAAEKFCERYNIKDKHIYIYINKKIPIAAGLAGGSTDAAAVLIGLNVLFDMNISKNELCKIGVEIGADVPFCILKGAMYAHGIGDILIPCPPLPDCNILIAIGDTHVSTKAAFELYDTMNLPKDTEMKERLINGLHDGDLRIVCGNLYNTFENIIAEADRTTKLINRYNPVGSMMSGSGPAVYAIFEPNDEEKITRAIKEITQFGFKAFKCKPCKSQDIYIQTRQ